MMTTSPTPVPGTYPHDRLCGQIGIIPTSARINIMSKIVPIDMIRSPLKKKIHSKIWLASGDFLSLPRDWVGISSLERRSTFSLPGILAQSEPE